VGNDLSMAPPSFLGLASMLAAVRADAGHLFAAIQRENPYAAEARAQLLERLRSVHLRLLDAGDDALAIPADPAESADVAPPPCGVASGPIIARGS
jgi:hypothetical protein